MLSPTDMAPDFTLPSDQDGDITLSKLRPAPVVLFFYPRDNTAGCTRETIEFSEQKTAFEQAGARVFGISKDTLASHTKFRTKHGFDIPLLSDAEGNTCQDFGVWKEKSMYGKKFWGIERSTFLIDGQGKIAQVWRKVKVPNHVEAVLQAVQDL